ncbi:MAG: ATP synthase F1 subunit epsilon [Bacteroidales bacterium]|jgi:F-type H+-transporting ATPase subunit epsilon|nr:ATP synthase F1 subunit epsilon [Bacteroidales bacterium]
MLLEIITPQKTVYSGEVTLVKVPGSRGSFEILKNHAALISVLTAGELKFNTETEGTVYYHTGNGVVEVKDNHIVVLVDFIEQK